MSTRRTTPTTATRGDTPAQRPSVKRTPTLLLIGLVAAVVGSTVAVHWPVLSSQAVCYDDEAFLFEDAKLRNPSWRSVAGFFGEVLSSEHLRGYYEPLTQTSLMLDVAMGGSPQSLRPFHRSSLILHAVNTALVMLLLWTLFDEPWTAAMLALLFGLHPLMVEPLAWSWERKTTLAAFFVLLSFLSYVRFARRGRRIDYVLAVAAFVPALLAKPTSTPLPVLLIVLDWWPLNRLSPRTLREKIPFFALAGLSAAVTLISTAQNAEAKLAPMGIAAVPLRMGYLLAFYAGKILWPRELSPTYLLPQPFSLANPQVLIAVVVCATIVVALGLSTRWARGPAAGAAFFFFALLPTLGLVSYSWVTASDKYLYLPLIGLLLPLGAWLSRIWRAGTAAVGREATMSLRAAPRFVLVASVLALAGGEAYATRGTYPNWSTTDALLTHMVRLAPRSSIAHDALGTELLRRGKLDEAISHYRLAVENWPLTYYLPALPKLHRNLGIGLLRAGNVQGAIEHESRALEVNPAFGQARLNLAQALALANRPDEAVPHLERLLQEQAQSAPAHALLGDLMRRRGDTASAIKHYRDAIAIAPAPTVETRLADALTASGEPTEAVRHYRSVLKLEPNNPEVLTKLGIALARSGDLDGAIAQFRAALQMSPGNPGVHFNLGLALERSGQTAEAVQEYETTVRLAPNHKAAQARWHALSTRPATSPS